MCRIASIDFKPPIVLSGSSDKHLRLFDITSLQGWSTSPEYDGATPLSNTPLPFPLISTPGLVCQTCGSSSVQSPLPQPSTDGGRCIHGDLVRSVAVGYDFVLSGSYDLSIKARTLWFVQVRCHLIFKVWTGLGSSYWRACGWLDGRSYRSDILHWVWLYKGRISVFSHFRSTHAFDALWIDRFVRWRSGEPPRLKRDVR